MIKLTSSQTTITVAIITAVGVFFGGPSVSEFFKDRSLRHASIKIEERNIIDRLISQHAKLLEKYAEVSGEVMQLRGAVKQLKDTKVHRDAKELIAAKMNATPWPSWIQDIENRRWYINKAYCDAFGIPLRDFWNPINIIAQYPNSTVSKYIVNDMKVLETNAPLRFLEYIPEKILSPIGSDNKTNPWNVFKYPTPANGTKYMMGEAFPREKSSMLDFIK